jgi:hypothetical protein
MDSLNSKESETKSVLDLTQEPVHTNDNKDLGDIDAISKDSIVVKRGFQDVHYYSIPISKVEGWDGHVVWLKIPETEVINNYESNEEPDKSRYYTKDMGGYSDTDISRNRKINMPNVTVISHKDK